MRTETESVVTSGERESRKWSTSRRRCEWHGMFCNIQRGVAVRITSRPEDTVCVHGHGLGSRRADQEICIVHCGEVWQSHA